MELSPKASCSIWWVSAAVFFKTETIIDADSLLLKIRHISWVPFKFPEFLGSTTYNTTYPAFPLEALIEILQSL
jgi:hypothetical protein